MTFVYFKYIIFSQDLLYWSKCIIASDDNNLVMIVIVCNNNIVKDLYEIKTCFVCRRYRYARIARESVAQHQNNK